MKTLSVLFIAVLAIASATNFRRPLGSKQKLAVLAELDSRPIGNMIMSQLQIHLASEGLVDDIVNLVNELIAGVNEEQANADATHNQDVQTCEYELATTQAKFEHHVRERDTCLQTVADTKGLLADAEMELGQTIENIATLERLIAEGTALRAKQAAEYVVSQAKHQKALDALAEALKIIGNLMAGGSWIQLKSKVEKVTADLKALSHLEQFDAYGPIVEALVEISTTNQSANAIQEILDLLTKLRDHIQQVKDEETALEESRKAAWKQELSTLTTQRNNAVSRKGVLEANIDNYHTIIDNNVKNAAMHDAEQARFADLNANWQADCDARFAAYDSETASRTADLAVLNELAAYLAEQVPAMEDYLMERVNTF